MVKGVSDELAAICRISELLCADFDLDRVLDVILQQAVELYDADAGSILMVDGDCLRICRAVNLSEEVIASAEIPLGSSIAGKVAATRKAVLINGKADEAEFPGVVERGEAISSSMCAPMMNRGDLLGVLTVRVRDDRVYDSSNLQFFQVLADHAAMAIATARFLQAERERFESSQRERERTEAVFAHMPDVMVAFGEDYVVHYNNVVAAQVFGGSESMVGEDIRLFFPAVSWKNVFEQMKDRNAVVYLEVQPVGSKGESTWRGAISSWKDSTSGRLYVMIMHDATERLRVERMKTEFMSAVSHELKTPLTSVIGFLELLQEKQLAPERQQKCLSICRDEAQRLLRLIEEVLLVSKLEHGSFHINKSTHYLDELVERLVNSVAERYPSYKFSFTKPKRNVLVEYDEVLVGQVITNLLTNAVKYTPAGKGRIKVRLERQKEQVVVSVTDNGIGIPKDKIPYIFEKFYRVDNSLTRQQGGVGLGLANARHIVESHGGTVWADSVEGKGSKFSFTLPCRSK